MASIRDLKKDINSTLGTIIEDVYIWETAKQQHNSEAGNAIVDEAIAVFDALITKVNDKTVANRKSHLKQVHRELKEKAKELTEKLHALNQSVTPELSQSYPH